MQECNEKSDHSRLLDQSRSHWASLLIDTLMVLSHTLNIDVTHMDVIIVVICDRYAHSIVFDHRRVAVRFRVRDVHRSRLIAQHVQIIACAVVKFAVVLFAGRRNVVEVVLEARDLALYSSCHRVGELGRHLFVILNLHLPIELNRLAKLSYRFLNAVQDLILPSDLTSD